MGRTPCLCQRLTVLGSVPSRLAISAHGRPGLLLEPHQALREVVGEDVGSSAVMCALSRHGRRSFRRSSPGPSRPGRPVSGSPGRQPKRALPLPPVLLPHTWDNPLRAERCPPVLPSAAGLRCAEPSLPPALRRWVDVVGPAAQARRVDGLHPVHVLDPRGDAGVGEGRRRALGCPPRTPAGRSRPHWGDAAGSGSP